MEKIAVLNLAKLMYGKTGYSVEPNETLPLPESFDFDNAEECARQICAIMSNASGGHTLIDCTLRVDYQDRTANITSSGMHVFYRPVDMPKIGVEEALAKMERIVTIPLGTVATDQYGDGWKRARWI
jgi:hypothetical protein